MQMRGVEKQNSVTTTSDFTGAFNQAKTREEFMNLIRNSWFCFWYLLMIFKVEKSAFFYLYFIEFIYPSFIFVAELIISTLSFKKPQKRKLVTLISLMNAENLSRFLHGLYKCATSLCLMHYVFLPNALHLSVHRYAWICLFLRRKIIIPLWYW